MFVESGNFDSRSGERLKESVQGFHTVATGKIKRKKENKSKRFYQNKLSRSCFPLFLSSFFCLKTAICGRGLRGGYHHAREELLLKSMPLHVNRVAECTRMCAGAFYIEVKYLKICCSQTNGKLVLISANNNNNYNNNNNNNNDDIETKTTTKTTTTDSSLFCSL